jgi:carbonic anhydrase
MNSIRRPGVVHSARLLDPITETEIHAMRSLVVGLVAACLELAGCASTHHDAAPHGASAMHDESGVSAAEAKNRLVQGNARYVAGRTEHPRQGHDRRAELSTSQHPFAVILGCADSRTSPEIIFDQGLGDLFVTREAGNVVGDHTYGTIEYAVEHLHVPLVVVMGHERCGAIAAARDTIAAHGTADGHIESLVVAIRPAVQATIGQDAEATCKANVRNVVHALRTSTPILRHTADEGHVVIVGAYYDLDTGEVTFLPD